MPSHHDIRQHIRFCTASDGVRLAWASSGRGPVLVKAANYLTHLEDEWYSPVWRHWLQGLSSSRTLVRYDERGCGLSDRGVQDLSMDAWVRDLEAVVAAAGADRFDLLGISQGASVCVAYAARHPERVRRMVLYGGYARGRLRRGGGSEERLAAETMVNAMKVGWGLENPAFRRLFAAQLMPDADARQVESLDRLSRISVSAEEAARMEAAFYRIDVSAVAPRVETPTLVLHARDDAAIPFEEGRLLAGLLPDARFVPLDSRNHILLEQEHAWVVFQREVDRFLGGTPPGSASSLTLEGEVLTPRETEILHHLAGGLSNAVIAETLGLSEKTVRNHLSHVFAKLGVHSRAEAIVRSRRAGFGEDPAD